MWWSKVLVQAENLPSELLWPEASRSEQSATGRQCRITGRSRRSQGGYNNLIFFKNMITGAKYKICRRLGPGVYEKCQTQKFTISEAGRGKVRRRKTMSDYGNQLLDKQRIRFSYGLSERQFAKYVKEAMKSHGSATNHLFEKVETRLDNTIYRLGLAH